MYFLLCRAAGGLRSMQKEPESHLAYPRHQNRVIICKNAIDTGRKCEFIMAHIPYQLALARSKHTRAE